MSNVIYLICSLPSLTFGQSPPISMDEFLQDARKQLSQRSFKKLETMDIQNIITGSGELKGFITLFESFHEDLSKIRKAKVQNLNPNLTTLPKLILGKNPLEREQLIMQWQWEELSSFETGKTFTLTEVLIYKLKLQILCRLQSFNEDRGSQVLQSVVNPTNKKENSQCQVQKSNTQKQNRLVRKKS